MGIEIIPEYFIAPNGKLYYESKSFFRGCHEVDGVSVTELWRDAYQLNFEESELVFPVDFCPPPFEITEHVDRLVKVDSEFNVVDTILVPQRGFLNGGGFRLNLDWSLR